MIFFGIIIAVIGYALRSAGTDVLRRVFNPEGARSLEVLGFLGLLLGLILIVVGLIIVIRRS